MAHRPPVSDVFGARGRKWLAELELPEDERDTVTACLRHVDFLDAEVATLDRAIAMRALQNPDVLRLMTVPGVSVITATTFVAAIGDIRRFHSARLVGYLGLDPKVRQSGNTPARHGRISKQGSAAVRHVLVEAAWVAVRAPGPLRAFYERIRARRGAHVAAVATARKMASLFWCLLTRQQDYVYGQPSLTQKTPARRGSPVAQGPGPRRPGCPIRRDRAQPSRRSRDRPKRPTSGRCRLESHRRQDGRERDTGARISEVLEGQSRVADHKPLTSALRYVNRPRPPEASHRSRPTPSP